MELTAGNVIQLAFYIATLGVTMGVVKNELTHVNKSIGDIKSDIKEDVNRLETKQDKHNHIIERMTIAEQELKRVNEECSGNKEGVDVLNIKFNEMDKHLIEIHASVRSIHKRLDEE